MKVFDFSIKLSLKVFLIVPNYLVLKKKRIKIAREQKKKKISTKHQL